MKDLLPKRIWIAVYTAGQGAGVLSRGLHFRSIHNSEADALRIGLGSNVEGFSITEYVKCEPAVIPEDYPDGYKE